VNDKAKTWKDAEAPSKIMHFQGGSISLPDGSPSGGNLNKTISNMKNIKFLHTITNIILFQIILVIAPGIAQNHLTIPTYHWSYSYIQQLRVRGYLNELNTIQQPYTIAEVLNSLIKLQEQIQQNAVTLSSQDSWLIDFLIDEFQDDNFKNKDDAKLIFRPGIWVNGLVNNSDGETKFYGQVRSQLGFNFGNKLSFYNGILADQSLLDDPDYVGKKWRGFAAYTEQAYVRFNHSYFQFTLGRDFLNWGSGKTGRLLFSDNAQPLDLVEFNIKYKGIAFTAMAANLNQWRLADSLVQKYNVCKANRYVTAHRLTFNFKNKFHFGLTEALLYGGPHSTWELKYHNPLLYYHGELLNGGGYDGNGFLYVDFDLYPWRNWEFYGEVLVDDFQVEKTVDGDLEPNEIGMIFGFQHSDLFGLHGTMVGLEYVKIANRTYNSEKDWEKFVHFKKPIGYHLGNNFDRWNLTASYWFLKGWQAGVDLDYIRKGQGSILDPWNTPWTNYTVAQGYKEPFPYGIVEKSFLATFNLRFHVRVNIFLASQIVYQDIDNAFHVIGRKEAMWSLFLKLHWNFKGKFFY